MMHKVALAALLAAPSALAFTPADLSGVWSCVVKDGYRTTALQQANVEATFKAVDTPDDTKILRVVVFDKPDNTKASRRLSGRTYYTVNSVTEEHNFHGMLKNAVEGDFHLDPNSNNLECGGTLEPSAPLQTTKPLTSSPVANLDFHVDMLNKQGIDITGGLCSAQATGPWSFTMDDPDHFTLIVNPGDTQIDNWYTPASGNAWSVAEVALQVANPHVFIVEKCMRGLPLRSNMCERLARSKITSSDDMDRACTRDLVCAQSSSSQNWGCSGYKCCDVRGYVPPPTYQYPQYAQPQYYQPQYYAPQAQYNPFQGASFGNYWG